MPKTVRTNENAHNLRKRTKFSIRPEGLPFSDDIVRQIFDFIPLRQRTPLEFVSKRFRNIVLSSYKSVKIINLKQFRDEIKVNAEEGGDIADSNKILLPLRLILKKIQTISGKTDDESDSNDSLCLILKKLLAYFPNLEQISGFHAFTDTLETPSFILLSKIPRLKVVTFKKVSLDAEDFNEFLLNQPNLEEFSFLSGHLAYEKYEDGMDIYTILAPGFSNLGKLEKFRFTSTSGRFKKPEIVITSIPSSPRLKFFDIECEPESEYDVRTFINRFPCIENWDFSTAEKWKTAEKCRETFQILIDNGLKLKSLQLLLAEYENDAKMRETVNFLLSPVCQSLRKLVIKTSASRDDVKILLDAIFGQPWDDLEDFSYVVLFGKHEQPAESFLALGNLTRLKNLTLTRCVNAADMDRCIFSQSDPDDLEPEELDGDLRYETKAVTIFDQSTNFDFLTSLTNLRALKIDNYVISNEIFVKICTILGPQLTKLELDASYRARGDLGGTLIKNSALAKMAETCVNLTYLNLYEININYRSIRKIADNCRKLETLKILAADEKKSKNFSKRESGKIIDDDWLYLLARCQKLRHLTINKKHVDSLRRNVEFRSDYELSVRLCGKEKGASKNACLDVMKAVSDALNEFDS